MSDKNFTATDEDLFSVVKEIFNKIDSRGVHNIYISGHGVELLTVAEPTDEVADPYLAITYDEKSPDGHWVVENAKD